MSEVSSRPRVRSVVSRSVAAERIGTVFVGAVVSTTLRQLGRDLFVAQPTLDVRSVEQLVAGPDVTARLAALRVEATTRTLSSANPVLAEKAAALLALSEAPLVVRPDAVAAHVERLMQAPTVEAVQQAEASLVRTVTSENSMVVSDALAIACRQASIEAGFVHVETTTGPLGHIRVVATDPTGRALVSEIHRGTDTQAPSIETEVVGFTDGRCHGILDRFDASMEAQGVRIDGAPERKWTGGVCEMALARDFIRQKVAPAAQPKEPQATARLRRAKRPTNVQQSRG